MEVVASHHETSFDGVGAVNADGEVMIFVDVDVGRFTEYTIDGDHIRLSGRGAEPHARGYVPPLVHAAQMMRTIQVTRLDEVGTPLDVALLRHRKGSPR